MNLFLNYNSSVFIKSGCTAKVKNTIKIVYLIVVILSLLLQWFRQCQRDISLFINVFFYMSGDFVSDISLKMKRHQDRHKSIKFEV